MSVRSGRMRLAQRRERNSGNGLKGLLYILRSVFVLGVGVWSRGFFAFKLMTVDI